MRSIPGSGIRSSRNLIGCVRGGSASGSIVCSSSTVRSIPRRSCGMACGSTSLVYSGSALSGVIGSCC